MELDWGWSQLMVMSRYQESDTRSGYNVVLYTFKRIVNLEIHNEGYHRFTSLKLEIQQIHPQLTTFSFQEPDWR